MKGIGFALALLAALGAEAAGRPAPPPFHEAEPVTSEAEPVLGAAASADGRRLVVSATRGEFADLWLRSADPARVELPRRLTFDPADETEPALSPDGRWLAWVGHGHDAKGDVYVLNLESPGGEPRRLTGREAEDGGPAFSPDGRTLYFHRREDGGGRIFRLDLGEASPAARPVAAAGEGTFPAVSPDGRRLAFVSRRVDPGGDLFVLDLAGGGVTALTSGPAVDAFPSWSPDGRTVLFTRFGLDTDRDGRLSERDAGVLSRVGADGAGRPLPLTSWGRSAVRGQLAGGRLLFLSPRGGVPNVWSLPAEGEVPGLPTAGAQLALARELAGRVPADLPLAILACERVAERFPAGGEAPRATYEAGLLALALGEPGAAASAFDRVLLDYPGSSPEAPLAALQAALLRARGRAAATLSQPERRRIGADAGAELRRIAAQARGAPTVEARAALEEAKLLLELDPGPGALTAALDLLDLVAREHPADRAEAAEALVARARAYGRVAPPAEVRRALVAALDAYGDVEPWADRAADGVVELTLAPLADLPEPRALDERVRVLRELAAENRRLRPRLATAALNRVGDLCEQQDEWALAKAAYREVLRDYSVVTSRTAGARLALAELLYREERYREAIDLYEAETRLRPAEDPIYRLARAGYVRRSADAGQALLRNGEAAAARKVFRELLDYDDGIVEAHRGYVQAAAARGELEPALAAYRRRREASPSDPLAAYGLGLALTYRETARDAREALPLLERAVALRGQVEYFHQTLGYVHEVLETAYGERGHLEAAAEAYQKALLLNDPAANPANRANLLLNLGNAWHLLGQHGRAFDAYAKRLETGRPFDSADQEVLFLRRLGSSAFQARQPARAAEAFEKALALVDATRDPRAASAALDRVARYVLDRVAAPAKRSGSAAAADAVAAAQSELNGRLAALSRGDLAPPPDPRWEAYRAGVAALLTEQRALNRRAAALPVSGAGEDLAALTVRAEAALEEPRRLAVLRAELLDRLGLARQEAGQWAAAREAFEAAFRANEALGLTANLARNRRSAAWADYQRAGEAGAPERDDLLRAAQAGFREARELVRRHGVPPPSPGVRAGEGGLLNLAVSVEVNKGSSTEAAYGFTAEQEERLCEAFLARIGIELGETAAAEEALRPQLARYPEGQEVAGPDAHGASLLFHRAGQLAAARGGYAEAFEAFRRSLELARQAGNAAAACQNAANMAHCAARLAARGGAGPERLAALARADRQAADLLASDPSARSGPFAAAWHGAMSVHWAALASAGRPAGAEAGARGLALWSRAGEHLGAGLAALGRPEGERSRLALAAALHLNLADVRDAVGDGPALAGREREEALALAEAGLLPELAWRALAGLGRRDEALAALEAVPALRAAWGPGEVASAFGPAVARLADEGRGEEAFNLAERLAELDRVGRLAPLTLGALRPGERAALSAAVPRWLRLRDVRRRLAAAAGEERGYLEESLARETALLEAELGKGWARLPSLVRGAPTPAEREAAALVLGLEARAEEAADAAVAGGEPAGGERRRERQALLAQARQVLAEARAALPEGSPAGLLGLLGPAPAELVEAMAGLGEGESLLRLYPGGEGWVWFLATPDALETGRAARWGDLPARAAAATYLAWEEPGELPPEPAGARVLSATHLVRAAAGRKPFKRALLALPARAWALPGFEARPAPAGVSEAALREALAGVHTLLLGGRVAVSSWVPLRPGERPRPDLLADLGGTGRARLPDLAAAGGQVSLAALADVDADALYPAGHLLSLFGWPTLALPRGADGGFAERFLAAYGSGSAAEAAREARGSLLGYRGMDPEQAAALARERFESSVRSAQGALAAEDALGALARIEDALLTAEEAPDLAAYLPDLRRFGREAAFRAGRAERAAEHARALVDLLAASEPDGAAHAEALLALGAVEARLERYPEAAAHLAEAREMLAALDLGPEEASALASLGLVFENATEYDRALTQFEAAAERGRSAGQGELVARQHVNLGRLYDLRLSQYARARQSYEAALAAWRELGDRAGQAQAHLDAGRCLRLLGNFPAAAERYAEALALLADEAGGVDARLRTRVRIEQANSAWFQARYQEAFDLLREVDAAAREHGWTAERVMAGNTAGLLWWTLGDGEKALRRLRETLDLAAKLAARDDEVATTLNNLGLVYRDLGRHADALEALDRALAIDRRLRSRWAVAYDLRNKGLTLLRMGRPAEALPLLAESGVEAAAIGDRVNQAKALLALGECRLALGGEGADAAFQEALELSRALGTPEVEWRALYGRAQGRLAAGERAAARALLTEAAGVIEGMRASIKIDQLKDGFLAGKGAVYEALVRLLADEDDVAGAFEVAERSRARGFIDLLGNQRLTLAGAVDQALYDRQQALRARMDETSALLAQATAAAEKAAYGEALARLRDEHRDLLLEIQAKSPQLASLVAVDPLRAAEVQGLLEPGVALAVYYVLPGEVLCWVLTGETLTLARSPAPRDALGESILEVRRLIQNLEPLEARSRELFDLLLAPVLPRLAGVRTLGIVPHGSLHYLSFATLSDGTDFLADRMPLFYLPSASVLRYTLARRGAAKNRRMLAIGNPDLGDPFLDLPFAEQEVGSIRWSFPEVTVLTQEKATESWVVGHIGEFGVIHLASHGEFDPVNPLFSAVKLTRDRAADGNLEAAEVFGLRLTADLVVLSACQTGLGKVTQGDDVVGLNRSFLYAGTHTIASSLWRVSDVATAQLAKTFYREYALRDKAEALRRAMLHVKNRYPHPGYWGGFVLTGDYR